MIFYLRLCPSPEELAEVLFMCSGCCVRAHLVGLGAWSAVRAETWSPAYPVIRVSPESLPESEAFVSEQCGAHLTAAAVVDEGNPLPGSGWP